MDKDIIYRSTMRSILGGRLFNYPGQNQADSVVLYWDSDCSEVFETPETVANIRGKYIENVKYVITHFQETIPHVMFGGPGL